VFVTGEVDGPNSTFRLLLNVNGTFRSGSLPISNAGGSFQVADIDHDGWLDFLVSSDQNSGTPRYGIYQGIGAGRLRAIERFPEVNNDGASDALLSIYNSATRQFEGFQLYTNRSAVLNSPPSAPRNLRAFAQGQQVVLSWSPSQDLNQRSGFTYNVRVGTTPDSSDILSAAALPDGKLLFVGPGNAGGRTQDRKSTRLNS